MFGQRKKTTAQDLHLPCRRRFLAYSSGVAASLLVPAALAHTDSRSGSERSLAFQNLHTGEKLRTVYWAEGEYIADSLKDIERILRDHRTGDRHPIDRQLLDILTAVQHQTGSNKPFQIISGYRSPKTNKMLNSSTSGVAKRSLHMLGKAIDVRIPGHDLRQLRRAALALKAGGVGYYPKSGFVHLDTGRVRSW
jgi:uncharacterized protein YcbK (DUF882 family)